MRAFLVVVAVWAVQVYGRRTPVEAPVSYTSVTARDPTLCSRATSCCGSGTPFVLAYVSAEGTWIGTAHLGDLDVPPGAAPPGRAGGARVRLDNPVAADSMVQVMQMAPFSSLLIPDVVVTVAPDAPMGAVVALLRATDAATHPVRLFPSIRPKRDWIARR